MFLNVQELQWRKVRFQESFRPGVIEYLDDRLRQATPLEAGGTVELSPATMEIRVRGHLSVRMEADCDRCLETAGFPVETDFDLVYRPMSRTLADEVILAEDESEVGFYQGGGLELMDLLREQVVLALPMQRVCCEDCKGICPVCGQNRNLAACDCHPHPADDRWAVLREL